MNDQPEDFLPKLTDMAAAAIGLHELFTSYVDAGFTRGEALQMVMCILTAAAQNGKDN